MKDKEIQQPYSIYGNELNKISQLKKSNLPKFKQVFILKEFADKLGFSLTSEEISDKIGLPLISGKISEKEIRCFSCNKKELHRINDGLTFRGIDGDSVVSITDEGEYVMVFYKIKI